MDTADEDVLYDQLEPSLNTLLHTTSLRWIFVGGKGGVGKTTTACSIGIELSKTRDKVLVLSTDPAHNLSDAFSQKFSGVPTLVKGFTNLFAMELDTAYQSSNQFTGSEGSTTGSLAKMLPDLISALPGIDEAFGFAELMQSVQTFDYSTIVFDTAPTGHTLRLLKFPDVIEKALRKLSSYRDKISGTINMFNMIAGQTIDEEELNNRFDMMKAVTVTVRETFRDPTLTTFVCVCIPEFLSLYETERLVQELARQGIDCSNIIVNQVILPVGRNIGLSTEVAQKMIDGLENSSGGGIINSSNDNHHYKELRSISLQVMERLKVLQASHTSRRKMQIKYLRQIYDLYSGDFHVLCMSLQPEEVRGVEKLRKMGQLLQIETRINDIMFIEDDQDL